MCFYITGDTHRDFDRIEEFFEENETTADKSTEKWLQYIHDIRKVV